MTQPQQWVPKKFADQELDIAMRVIYQSHYTLRRTSLNTVFNEETIDRGTANVTGSLLKFKTGLAKVTNVVAVLDSGSAGVAEILSCRPTPNKAGFLDFFVVKTDGTPSTTSRLVRWTAFGNL